MITIIGFISQSSRNLLGQLAPRKKAKKRYSEHHAMVPFFGTVVGTLFSFQNNPSQELI